jgi:hypothetical protein
MAEASSSRRPSSGTLGPGRTALAIDQLVRIARGDAAADSVVGDAGALGD